MNYEQEEEFLTNDLSRKLAQVRGRGGGGGRAGGRRGRGGGEEGEGRGGRESICSWRCKLINRDNYCVNGGTVMC